MIDRRLILLSATAWAGAKAVRAAEPPAKAFAATTMSLYLPEETMLERGPPTSLLVDYVKALLAAAEKAVAAAPVGRGASGALVVALKPPGRSRVWVMVGDGAREAEFTTLFKGPLEAVPPPAGVRDVDAFALQFNVWGGGTPLPSASVPVPAEWLRALPKGGGMLPDDALRVVWPN
jgi:hypothetical protein